MQTLLGTQAAWRALSQDRARTATGLVFGIEATTGVWIPTLMCGTACGNRAEERQPCHR